MQHTFRFVTLRWKWNVFTAVFVNDNMRIEVDECRSYLDVIAGWHLSSWRFSETETLYSSVCKWQHVYGRCIRVNIRWWTSGIIGISDARHSASAPTLKGLILILTLFSSTNGSASHLPLIYVCHLLFTRLMTHALLTPAPPSGVRMSVHCRKELTAQTICATSGTMKE